jgi:hypothetical protein
MIFANSAIKHTYLLEDIWHQTGLLSCLYTVHLESSQTMSVKDQKFKLEKIYYLRVQHSPLVNQYMIYNVCIMIGSFS